MTYISTLELAGVPKGNNHKKILLVELWIQTSCTLLKNILPGVEGLGKYIHLWANSFQHFIQPDAWTGNLKNLITEMTFTSVIALMVACSTWNNYRPTQRPWGNWSESYYSLMILYLFPTFYKKFETIGVWLNGTKSGMYQEMMLATLWSGTKCNMTLSSLLWSKFLRLFNLSQN